MALTRPTIIQKPFADSGDKNIIPIPSQVGIIDGAASWETGFPPDTLRDIGDGGIAPDGLDFNGLFNIITQHIRFMNAGGYPRFDATLCTEIGGYPVGAVLQDNSGVNIYRNVLANNTANFNTTPASIGVSWIPVNMGAPASCSKETPNVATTDGHTHYIYSATYADNAQYAGNSGLFDGYDSTAFVFQSQFVNSGNVSKIPGSIVFQTGESGALNIDTNVTFTFSEAFSSEPKVIPYIKNGSLTSDDVFARLVSVTATQVTIRAECTPNPSNSGTRYVGYFAIGTIN